MIMLLSGVRLVARCMVVLKMRSVAGGYVRVSRRRVMMGVGTRRIHGHRRRGVCMRERWGRLRMPLMT